MDVHTLLFATGALKHDDIAGKRILEVGSRNVNGSVRPSVCAHSPLEYIGVDIAPGPGVDQIANATKLVATFGAQTFDGVICANTLEHILLWRSAIYSMTTVLREGGWILMAVPAPGFGRHDHPCDYWRVTVDDLRKIFAGYEVISVSENSPISCIFARNRKGPFTDLSTLSLSPVGLRETVVAWIEGAKDGALKAGGRVYQVICG